MVSCMLCGNNYSVYALFFCPKSCEHLFILYISNRMNITQKMNKMNNVCSFYAKKATTIIVMEPKGIYKIH
jgi:adenosine/AMP kinase